MDRDLEREAWDKARLSLSLYLPASFFFSLLLDGILKRGARCRIDHTICKNRDKTSSSFDLGILVANSSSVNNRKLSKGNNTKRNFERREEWGYGFEKVGRINWFLPWRGISLDLTVTFLVKRNLVIGDVQKEKVSGHEHARGTFDERGFWRRRIGKSDETKGRWHPRGCLLSILPLLSHSTGRSRAYYLMNMYRRGRS